MKNRRAFLFSLLLSLVGFLAFIPPEDGEIEKLVSALQRWKEVNPQEKIHLHMDKPYYALGDTIWFKAYVTVGSRHQLSAISGALYVELLDGRDSLIKELKLPVVSGTTYGDFTLDEDLMPGNYRLRAYTQWMRNAGEEYFYDRTVSVGSLSETEVVSKNMSPGTSRSTEAAPIQADIQFFPESGHLMNGIASRIAFKAIGANGRGLNVRGIIVDEADKQIIGFESLYAGMGSVMLKPESGKTYSAKVILPDSSQRIIALPKALSSGYVLSIYQPVRDSVLIRINSPADIYQSTSRNVNLMVQSGGEVIFASPIKISRSITSVWLHKEIFPSGIAQFTLFDNDNVPLNERIAFIRANDQMELSLSTEKTVYRSREPININLFAKSSEGKPMAGNFSVSVIDERKVPFADSLGHSIFSNLLLSADLKGDVENPNYYFGTETEQVNSALDNLMLTQGYRRFDWKAISSDSLAKPQFPAEGIGTVFSGKVLALNGKPESNATVTLMALKANLIQNSKTDAEGRFKFGEFVLTDSIRATFQARNEKNKTKVELILDSVAKIGPAKLRKKSMVDTDVEKQLQIYIDNSKKLDSIYASTGQFDRVRRLKEVNIKGVRTERKYFSQGMMKVPEGHADLSIDMSKEKTFASMESFIREKLAGRGVKFKSYRPDTLGPEVASFPWMDDPVLRALVPMKIVIDGRRLQPEDAVDVFNNSTLDAEDIAKIDVVTTNAALIGMFGGPVIMFYTKADKFIRKPGLNVVNISPRGFNKVKSFYEPKYNLGNNSPLPDLRSTVYWNPDLRIYASGKTSINFFNADGPGTYKVIVEGINEHGELGRAVYRYEVEAAANEFQAQVNHSNSIVASLDSLQKRLPVEKVYLHTDKPYYNLGDTLWFKSYLLNATNFSGSSMSKFLYVELVDDSTEVVRRISVPVSDGLGWAQIPLSTNIFHEGAYTLRAYTNWMQNFRNDYLFTRRLYLGKPSINTWLVRSGAEINSHDQLEVNIQLKRSDNSAVGLKEVEVRIYEGDKYLTKQELMTSQDGELKFSSKLKEKADGRNIRVEIRNKNKADGNQILHVPLRVNRSQFIDLQFLPEGGQLVAGLPSLVGFKAIGEDGKGINVMGKIFDSSGAEAGSFASLHNGMGSFDFTPRPDDSYTAKIMLPEDVGKAYPLPVVNREGTMLRVRNNQDSIRIELAASNNAVDMDSVYYLIGTSRGKVYYSSTVDFGKASLNISRTTFPSGIARFTLLKGRRPLNERIIFIDHKDQLDVAIKASKISYLQRDSVSLSIAVKDRSGIPVKGSFSLSVTDDSQVKADSLGNYGIAASLLLTSDLKGTVEDPGYYLSGNEPQRLEALDNLMLTQGWTGYDWKGVFSPAVSPKFLAEKEFKVTGKVVNISNRPVSGAQVLISSQKPSFITTTLTDANGRYTFKDLPQIDSGSFFIQSRTSKGKSMNFGGIDVERFQPAPVSPTFRDQLMPWYVNSDAEQLNYVQQMARKTKEEFFRQSGVRLEEVRIVAKKIIKGSFNRNGPGNADLVFDEKDIKESAVMNLYQLIKQKLPGLRVVMEDGLPTLKYNNYMVTIEIDRGPLPLQLNANPTVEELVAGLSEFKIAGFIGLEVMYSRKYMNAYAHPPKIVTYTGEQIMNSESQVRTGAYEFEASNFDGVQTGVSPFYIPGFKGSGYLDARVNVLTNKTREIAVISITTTTKRGWHRINKPDVVSYRPLPIMKAQTFYSPKYSVNPADVAEPDLRSAIFWEPNIVTDANGTARVSFYSADIPGSYTVTLEGSGKDGNIGSKKATLTVGNQLDNTKK